MKGTFDVDFGVFAGDVGCVIMASGMSRRFGRNKLMEPFCGKPMIQYILDSTKGLFGKRIVVTRHEEVRDLCREIGIPVLLHALPHRSDTIRLGCEYFAQMEHIMFCPSDQPLLQADSIRAMLLSAKNEPDKMLRLCFEEQCGMPALFPKWTFDMLQQLPEGKGGSYVMKAYPDKTAYVQARFAQELMDADTPEELEELSAFAFHPCG